MTTRALSITLSDMSAETDGIINYFKASGLAGKVTDIDGPGHAKNSNHYKGLAVDFGFTVGQYDSPGLREIFNLFVPVEQHLLELIQSSTTFVILQGKRIDRDTFRRLHPSTFAAHHNHVHIAVKKGAILKPTPKPPNPYVPPVVTDLGDKVPKHLFFKAIEVGPKGSGSVPLHEYRVEQLVSADVNMGDDFEFGPVTFRRGVKNGKVAYFFSGATPRAVIGVHVVVNA